MRLDLKCCLGLGLFVASATISCGTSSGIDLYAGGQAGRDAGASGRAGSSALGSGGNAAGSGGTGGGGSGFGGAGAAGGNGAFGAGGSTGSGFGGSGGSLGASGASGVGGSLGIDAAAGSGGTGTSDSGINVAGSVVCGSGRCSLPSEFCCRYVNGQAPACVATGATCLEGTDLLCDGPEDCDTGQVCCGRLVQSNFGRVYNRVSCTAPSDCAGTNDRIVCGSDSTECQNGRVCAPSDVAPELRICREP